MIRPDRSKQFRIWIAAALLGVALFAAQRGGTVRAPARSPLGYAALDSLTSLQEAVRAITDCGIDCSGVVYFWTHRMPLSLAGIQNVSKAADNLSLSLTLVALDELQEYAYEGLEMIPVADAMLRASVHAHAPAILVHDQAQFVGGAVLGYKTAEAYQAIILQRFSQDRSRGGVTSPPWSPQTILTAAEHGRPLADYDAVGSPSAYFRTVPGRQALAYESQRRIYLLDLADGESRVAPGQIDFIPTPDGRYFVTPGPGDGGLTFYDADEVFEAAQANRRRTVQPIFTDPLMRDQYPSVGILREDELSIRYRVLTSWFLSIAYRDYEIRVNPRTRESSVRPLADPVTPCNGMTLSTPILSPDGLELAARDEATGTTKIFQILSGGGCLEVSDLGVATSKVAWHRSGRMLTFATPGVDRGAGIFVFDRITRGLHRVPDSDDAIRLTIPDFVGDDVVFLVSARSGEGRSLFRVVGQMR